MVRASRATKRHRSPRGRCWTSNSNPPGPSSHLMQRRKWHPSFAAMVDDSITYALAYMSALLVASGSPSQKIRSHMEIRRVPLRPLCSQAKICKLDRSAAQVWRIQLSLHQSVSSHPAKYMYICSGAKKVLDLISIIYTQLEHPQLVHARLRSRP